MAAATGLDLIKTGAQFSNSEWAVVSVGFVASFIFAWLAVRWLLRYISRHNFAAFGWYRLILAVLIYVLVYFGVS